MMRSDFRGLWDSAPMMVHTFPAIQYSNVDDSRGASDASDGHSLGLSRFVTGIPSDPVSG